MPPKDAANWMADPEDIPNLLKFLHAQQSHCGEGGTGTKLSSMRQLLICTNLGHLPRVDQRQPMLLVINGGMCVLLHIDSLYGTDIFLSQICKLLEYILQVKQKIYPGMSGWTYTNEHGFNGTNENRDTWNNFS
jgi:hypothetical protein